MKNPHTILVQKIFYGQELQAPYIPQNRRLRAIQYSSRLRVMVIQSIYEFNIDQYRMISMEGQVTTISIPHLIPQRTLVKVINTRGQGETGNALFVGNVANIIFSHDETSFMEIMIKNKRFETRALTTDGQIIHDTFTIMERPIGLTDKILITMYLTKEPFYYEGKLQENFIFMDTLHKKTNKLKKITVVNIQLRLWSDPHTIIKVIKSPLPKAKMVQNRLFIGPVNLFHVIPGPLNTFLFGYQYDEPYIRLLVKSYIKGHRTTYVAKYRIMPYINMANFLIDKLEYKDEEAFLEDVNSE